jgi:hypothetical protein
MEDTIERIKKYVTERIKDDNFMCVYDKEEYINRRIRAHILFLTTNMNIIEISEYVLKQDGLTTPLYQSKRDFSQYNFTLRHNILNMSIEDIKKRYLDPPEEVEERMMFRIELYKDGWTVEQIENYIYKNILKQPLPKLDIKLHIHFYENTMKRLNINKKEREKEIGRPSLPPLLKDYIRNKHRSKNKEVMRQTYKFSKEFYRIKDNLLTKEDIVRLEGMFDDKNDELLLKLKELHNI